MVYTGITGLFESEYTYNNIKTSAGFNIINDAIKNGKLEIRIILAQDRSGSTATLSYLGNKSFDVIINEPDCMFMIHDESDLLLYPKYNPSDMYNYIAGIYEKRHTTNKPLRMLIKLMPHSWPLCYDGRELLELYPKPLWLIRNPALSISSRIRLISKLLLNNFEGTNFGIKKDEYELLKNAINQDDFSEFIFDFWLSHENLFFRYDHNQNHIFSAMKIYESSKSSWIKGLINHNNIVRNNYFDDILYRDKGILYISRLRKIWQENNEYYFPEVLDFEIFQYNPEGISKQINEIWQIPLDDNGNSCEIINAYNDFYKKRASKFCECAFGDALSLNAIIKKPTTKPLPFDKFPDFLKQEIPLLVSDFYSSMKHSIFHYPQLTENDIELNPSFLMNAWIKNTNKTIPQKTKNNLLKQIFNPCSENGKYLRQIIAVNNNLCRLVLSL